MESNTSGTAFRIGAVYRQRNGWIVKLCDASEFSHVIDPKTTAWAKRPRGGDFTIGEGFRRLSYGCDTCTVPLSVGDRTLLPGELHQVNGEWVPVEAPAKPASAPIPTAIPFERPLSPREVEWKLRQALMRDVAEAATREAEARRCAPLPACAGLLRLAPMR